MKQATVFNYEIHHQEVNSWLKAHGMSPLDKDLIPSYGCMVEGVAVGFLYITDSALGIIENIIANPKASKEERHSALVQVATGIESMAREKRVKVLIGLAASREIIERSRICGFVQLTNTYTLVRKDL